MIGWLILRWREEGGEGGKEEEKKGEDRREFGGTVRKGGQYVIVERVLVEGLEAKGSEK